MAHTSRSIVNTATSGFDATASDEPAQTPAYISFDRKVLCFFVYSQEGVSEARLETFRYRFVNLVFSSFS